MAAELGMLLLQHFPLGSNAPVYATPTSLLGSLRRSLCEIELLTNTSKKWAVLTPVLPRGTVYLPRFYPPFYPDTVYPPERDKAGGKNGVKRVDRCHQGESGVKSG